MSGAASDNEVSLGSVPDIETFIQAEKTREDATKQSADKEVVATKTTDNEAESGHIDVDEFGMNENDLKKDVQEEKHENSDPNEENDVPELEDSIMEEYEVNEVEDQANDGEKVMDQQQQPAEPVVSSATPQIDTSYDFSENQEMLNLPKKRVPSYLQPTISYSQKVRAKYDPRSVSGSSQRSFSGSRTYSAEYHLREARLYDQRQNEMDTGVSREGSTDSPDSAGGLDIPKRGGSRKQVRREFSREFTPSFPFNKENVN